MFEDLKDKILKGAAIYINDDFIDVAKAELTLKGLKVTFIQRYPVLRSVSDLSKEESKGQLESILERAFEDDIPYRVAVNIINHDFILRRFSFGEVPERELGNVVGYEAQKYIPYPIEGMVYSYEKSSKNKGMQEVLFAGTRAKEVEGLLQFFAEKEILPSVISCRASLVSMLLNVESRLEQEKAYVSLHFDPSNKITITGISKKQPIFFRDIDIVSGDDEFRTTELRYPYLKDVWGALDTEVFNATEYLKRESKANVEKVFISGFIPSEDEALLSANFGVPFERVEFEKFILKGTSNPDRHLPVLSLLYQSFHKPFLNLAPKKVTQRDFYAFKPVVKKIAAAFGCVMLIHVLLSGINFFQSKKTEQVKSNVAAYCASIGTLGPTATPTEIKYLKENTEEKVEYISKMISTKIHMTQKLNRLGLSINDVSWIKTFNFRNILGGKTKGSLTIRGSIYAPPEEGVSGINIILEKLQNDKEMIEGFEEVKLVTMKKKKVLDNEITEFELLIK